MTVNELIGTASYTTLYLSDVPYWVFAVMFLILLCGCLEAGYLIGRTWHYKVEASSNVALGALLGLLGLILAFTYGYTLTRLDRNQTAMLGQANAIGTMFLRADLAKEPDRSELRKLVYEYAKIRKIPWEEDLSLQLFIDKTIKEDNIERKLWPAVIEATRRIEEPSKVALFSAMNDVLDSATEAKSMGRDSMPIIVLAMMVLTAAAAMFVMGHTAGSEGIMSRWRTTAFAGVLVFIMVVIVDFDRSFSGFILVNDYAMGDLIKGLQAAI